MSGVNRVILLGHVGKDPEVRFLPSSMPVANFSLATNEADKGASLYAHNNYSPNFKPSMAKILIWAEDGKTQVEVCDD